MNMTNSLQATDAPAFLPVFRPQLPLARELLPYLEQIDRTRWYSNFGPLSAALEQRLEKHLGTGRGSVCSVSNGTVAITLALMAQEAPRGTLCLLPSWTFTATAAAVLAAGLVPCFVDVDEATQALDPRQAKELITRAPGTVGAIVVVAPFGAPVDVQAWEDFTHATNIAVVIDAAAAFDTLTSHPLMKVQDIAMTVSLHATKVLGAGEGGFVVSRNTGLIYKVKRLSVYGFDGERRAEYLGTNAKLSEYAAAVALASLDQWKDTRQGWQMLRSRYLKHLEGSGLHIWAGKDWVTNTINVILGERACEMADALKVRGIDTRRWWCEGCHRQPAYVKFPKLSTMSATDRLAASMLGLPSALDMTEGEVMRVCGALVEEVARGS